MKEGVNGCERYQPATADNHSKATTCKYQKDTPQQRLFYLSHDVTESK